MIDLKLDGKVPNADKLRDQLLRKQDEVHAMLQKRAGQLTLEGKHTDAEYIYIRLFRFSDLESGVWPFDIMPSLVSICEKTGNLSVAEAAQQRILYWTMFYDVDHEKIAIETKKLSQFYTHFYDRIRNITLQQDGKIPIGNKLARIMVFVRMIDLDLESWDGLIKLMSIPDNALHIAISAGASEMITALLDYSGCDVNATDEDGGTALHTAVQRGEATTVKLLLENGIDLEVVNEQGDTALLLALWQSSEQAIGITKTLLDKGSDLMVRNHSGWTPLHLAVESGTPDLVKMILSYDLEVDAPDHAGATPLMLVAGWNSFNCVPISRQLIESGANVNATNDKGSTPLMSASLYGSLEMVQLFIERGADVLSRNRLGRTALHMVLSRTAGMKQEIISILINAQIDVEAKDDDGRSPLGIALKRGTLTIARQLLEHGADVEAEIEGERYLLHVVRLGNELATRLLLEYGADVHGQNTQGETALLIAACTGITSMVDILLRHGARIEARNNKGETPLYIAVFQCEESILQALIQYGANVEAKDLNGRKPLDVAVFGSNDAILKMLLSNGADASTLSQSGIDQIHKLLRRAIQDSDFPTVEMLLDHRPHAILAVDLTGNTPIHQVILQGHERHEPILDSLLQRFYGQTEPFMALNQAGNTPLHLAVLLRRYKIAGQLLAAQSLPDAKRNLQMWNYEGEQICDLLWPFVTDERQYDFQTLLQSIRRILGDDAYTVFERERIGIRHLMPL